MDNNYKGKIPKISEIIAKEIGVSHNYYTEEILSHNFKKFDEIFQYAKNILKKEGYKLTDEEFELFLDKNLSDEKFNEKLIYNYFGQNTRLVEFYRKILESDTSDLKVLNDIFKEFETYLNEEEVSIALTMKYVLHYSYSFWKIQYENNYDSVSLEKRPLWKNVVASDVGSVAGNLIRSALIAGISGPGAPITYAISFGLGTAMASGTTYLLN